MNNHKHILIVFSLLIIVFFISCRQTVGIKGADFEQGICVYNSSESGKVPVFYLTQTRSYFGYVEQTRKPSFIQQATLTLEGENMQETLTEYQRYDKQLCGQFVTGDSALVHYYKGKIPIVFGKEYTLNIYYQNKHVVSKMAIPPPVPIHHFTEKRIKDPKRKDSLIHVTIYIQDEAGKPNFYRVVRKFRGRTICKDPITGQNDTTFGNKVRYSSVFTDRKNELNLDGKMITRDFSLNQSAIFSDSLSFELQHLSSELGLFLRSIKDQEDDYDYLPDDLPDFLTTILPDSVPDPFVEPTQIRSNIENGAGCFGGVSVSSPVQVRIH